MLLSKTKFPQQSKQDWLSRMNQASKVGMVVLSGNSHKELFSMICRYVAAQTSSLTACHSSPLSCVSLLVCVEVQIN